MCIQPGTYYEYVLLSLLLLCYGRRMKIISTSSTGRGRMLLSFLIGHHILFVYFFFFCCRVDSVPSPLLLLHFNTRCIVFCLGTISERSCSSRSTRPCAWPRDSTDPTTRTNCCTNATSTGAKRRAPS